VRYQLLVEGKNSALAPVAAQVLQLLSICQKGLSSFELRSLLKVDDQTLERAVEENLCDLVIRLEFLWVVASPDMRRHVCKSVLSKEKRLALHAAISNSFEIKLNKNMTLLGERMFHFYMSRNHSELKQNLADIEHFMLMFTPRLKIDLFRYWQFLESAGYEPVGEYAKALNSFELRLAPPSLDLFKIVLQFCRFFKEYADFETELTPDFKHPLIINKLEIRSSPDASQKKLPASILLTKSASQQPQQKKLSTKRNDFFEDFNDVSVSDEDLAAEEFYDTEGSLISLDDFEGEELLDDQARVDAQGRQLVDYLSKIGILDELDKLGLATNKTNPSSVIAQVHDVRVSNQMDKFRQEHQAFVYEAKQRREEYLKNLNNQSLAPEEELPAQVSRERTSQDPDISFERDFSAGELPKPKLKPLVEDDDFIFPTPKRKTTYFHYKRWVWIMFPWACISSIRGLPFSYLITRCFEHPTKYLSVREEKVSAVHPDPLENCCEDSQELQENRQRAAQRRREPGREPAVPKTDRVRAQEKTQAHQTQDLLPGQVARLRGAALGHQRDGHRRAPRRPELALQDSPGFQNAQLRRVFRQAPEHRSQRSCRPQTEPLLQGQLPLPDLRRCLASEPASQPRETPGRLDPQTRLTPTPTHLRPAKT